MKQRNKTGQFIRTMPDRNCLVCGESYYSPDKKQKYCGLPCYYQMKKIRGDKVEWTDEMRKKFSVRQMGSGNPSFGKPAWSRGKKRPEMTGEKHPNYKGGYISKDGYKYISVEGRDVAEHHHFIELQVGRRLTSDEVVHHINGDKTDNRLENLMLTTRSEHPKIHTRIRRAQSI